MRTALISLFLVAALLSVAHAQAGSVDVVTRFYAAYHENEARKGSLEDFIGSQRERLEPSLHRMLARIAHNPGGGDQPWLDFDPFINGQMNAASLRLGPAVSKGGEVTIPVFISYRVKGHEQLALHVQVRQVAGRWCIANFLYPARGTAPSWDLRSWLKQQGMKP